MERRGAARAASYAGPWSGPRRLTCFLGTCASIRGLLCELRKRALLVDSKQLRLSLGDFLDLACDA